MSGPWIAGFTVLWVVVLLLGVILLGFVRRTSLVLERVEAMLRSSMDGISGLPRGSRLPRFEARTQAGAPLTHESLMGQRAVIIFIGPDCTPCEVLADELVRVADPPTAVPIYAVMTSLDGTTGDVLDMGPHVTAVVDEADDVSAAFRIGMSPYGFALNESGILVDRAVTNSVEDIQRLAQALEPEAADGARADHEHHAISTS